MQTASAPHKQLQQAMFTDAPDGVHEGVGGSQIAVGGSQRRLKRLTRCFRDLEVATQQHEKLPKSQTY